MNKPIHIFILTRIPKIALLLLVILFIQSCKGIFEVYPQDELLEKDFWKNAGDVESSVITCYYDLRLCQDELILYGLGRSDIIKPSHTEVRNMQKGIFTSTYKICDWSRWYKLIQDANLVIKKSEAVLERDPGFTETKYNQLLAEARFMRAFSYFYLIRMWKNIPLVTEPSLNDAQDYFPGNNNSPSEILEFIEQDLEFSIQHIPEEYINKENPELAQMQTRGRATKGAAWALLSDVYLWQNKFQECITACDNILNSPVYALLPNEKWWDIFNPQKGNTQEAIFELNYDKNFDYNARDRNSRYKYAMEDWFKNYLKAQNQISALWPFPDIRYYTLTGTGFNLSRKHVGADLSGNNLVTTDMNPNYLIYRLPHIIFNKAEALNRLFGNSALTEINTMIQNVERRAGVLDFEPVSGGTIEVEELILNYKLKETAFEGTRWFDLVRIGKRQWDENRTGMENVLVRKLVEIMPISDQAFVRGNLNNPESWYTPIHEDELLKNPNLVQNPYYENL